MNHLSISDLRDSQAVEIADREYRMADALDIKASIILAVIVFLATELEHFFPSPVVGSLAVLRCFSVALLIAAGISSVFELWPRDYKGEAAPGNFGSYIEKLRDYYSNVENRDAVVLERAIAGRGKRTIERAERYIFLNRKKTLFLEITFYCACASLFVDLAALAIHLF